MLQNRNIIIFGEDWGRFPSTTQYIGKVLLQFNRVMWIGSLAHRKPNFSLKDFIRLAEKLKRMLGFGDDGKTKSEKITPILIYPFIIPFHDNRLIRKINNKLLKRALLNAIKNYNFDNPILITSTPLISKIIGEIGETSSHYFCLDDYSHFDGVFKLLLNSENEMLSRISSCFAVSERLVELKKAKSGNTYFLPQGVLVKHFKRNEENIPFQLRNLNKPVIGFFGLISEWIDLDLMVFSAKKMTNCTFLVIGKPTVDISILNQVSNIKFVNEISFKDLPSYASAFDVGIIPFKLNELTIASNPLKLLEYLSLGIPVVSVNLPEVNKFNSYVQIAENYEDFVHKIRIAVEQDSETKRIERIAIAKKYSWESITELICEKVSIIENGP